MKSFINSVINHCFGFLAIIFLYSFVIFKTGFNFKQSGKFLEIIIECIKLIGDIIEDIFNEDKSEKPILRLVKDIENNN